MTRPDARISVIIPVYNGERYLAPLIETVARQSLQPLEIIVVDDGSTDGTAAALELLAGSRAGEAVVRVIHQGNARQSAARNAAAAVAEGDFLAFLDQDDSWHPRHLEELVEPLLADSGVGWSYSDFNEIDETGALVSRSYLGTHGFVFAKNSIADLIMRDGMMLPSASVVRTAAFREVGGFDPELCGYEDDDLFLRLFRAHWSSVFVPRALTTYRTHAASSSAQRTFQESRVKYFAKVSALLPDDPRRNRWYVSRLLAPRLIQSTLTDYSTAMRAGDVDLARFLATTIGELLRFRPRSVRTRLGLALLRRPRLCWSVVRATEALPRPLRVRLPLGLSSR